MHVRCTSLVPVATSLIHRRRGGHPWPAGPCVGPALAPPSRCSGV